MIEAERSLSLVKVFDGFNPDFEYSVRNAKDSIYRDIPVNGQIFPSMSPRLSPWAYERFSELMGATAIPGFDYIRKYEAGRAQPTFIHADHSISQWTAVLSLQDNNGQVAFWKHIETGQEYASNDPRWIDRIREEGNDESKWELLRAVHLQANRCVVYPSNLFHSRLPKVWDDARPRLVHVFFFNLKGNPK